MVSGVKQLSKVSSTTITTNLLFSKVGLQNSPSMVFLAKTNGREQMMVKAVAIKK